MALDRALEPKVIGESVATLRLLEELLEEMQDDARSSSGHVPALLALPQILLRIYAEILTVIKKLRQSKNVLQYAALARLQDTQDKLREVTSTTETATTDLLDGFDRALAILDGIDASLGTDTDTRECSEKVDELRDELHRMMNILQFQDITSQQLTYVASVLGDAEERLSTVIDLFDSTGIAVHSPEEGETRDEDEPRNYDPNATVQSVRERQALVDEIFSSEGR